MGEIPMSDDDGFSLSDALATAESVQATVRNALGIEQEQHVCSKCNTPCSKSTTYDHRTAAFNHGTQPSWYCDKCDTHYVREPDTDKHTLDLYGKGL